MLATDGCIDVCLKVGDLMDTMAERKWQMAAKVKAPHYVSWTAYTIVVQGRKFNPCPVLIDALVGV